MPCVVIMLCGILYFIQIIVGLMAFSIGSWPDGNDLTKREIVHLFLNPFYWAYILFKAIIIELIPFVKKRWSEFE